MSADRSPTSTADAVLGSIKLIRLDDRVLHTAGGLLPHELRSLDAIHLATAQQTTGGNVRVVHLRRQDG